MPTKQENRQNATELTHTDQGHNLAEVALQRRSRELALLIQASRAFSSSLDLHDVLTTVLEEVRSLMGVVASSIWLVDLRTDELVCRHATGPNNEKLSGWRLAPGQGIAGWTARYGESMVVPDTRADVRYFRGVEQETELPLRSILSVPLQLRGTTIGVLQVVDAAIGRFSAADLVLMESLAASAAVAIENARLYAQAQREITERQETERRLREQKELLEKTLHSLRDAVFVIDARTTVILDCNPAASHLFGYHRDEILGQTMTFLHAAEETPEEFQGLLYAALEEQGFLHQIEFEMQRKDGVVFPTEQSVMPLNGEGYGRVGWVVVVRDVTERVRTEAMQIRVDQQVRREREIEQRAEQQARMAAMGRLAAGIAHDFNNIISVIALYAQMSLHTPGLPDTVYERLETIDQQAWSAEELIQQILGFSRNAILERQPIDLLTFLKEQVKMLQRTVPESIRIDFRYGDGEYVVDADPTRVQQAVLNLVVNARDAMPEGGELCIALDRIRVDSRPDAAASQPEMLDGGRLPPGIEAGEWVRLAISDTGSGIPQDVLPHIFDPFFTTKAPGKGTGLGLSQVWDIVQAHDGYVDVTTETGAGAHFLLYLPALPSRQSMAPSHDPDHLHLVQGSGQTILVVEDDDTMRRALAESLESLNYRVLEAVNGQQALAFFKQRAPCPPTEPGRAIHLVLSDLVMPEMGGRALLQALREQAPDVRVVLMSGHPLDEELDELCTHWTIEWLPKPPRLERLAETIARALATPQGRD
jgi:PAS domain S-box-containing protein